MVDGSNWSGYELCRSMASAAVAAKVVFLSSGVCLPVSMDVCDCACNCRNICVSIQWGLSLLF